MKKLALLLTGMLLSTTTAAYEQCHSQLQYDIRVSSEALQVSERGKTLYEIREDGFLSIAGEELDLNSDQRELTEQYAGEIAALVPRWIHMVSDALTLAEDSLKLALGDAFGKDSAAVEKSTRALREARESFEQKARPEDGVFTLYASEYNDVVDGMEEELEGVFKSALGAVLSEIGSAITSSDRSFAEKMEAFGQNMKNFGREVGAAGQALEETGQALCASMKDIRKLERDVSRQIPQLSEYPLFY
jgi:hypothetical protein